MIVQYLTFILGLIIYSGILLFFGRLFIRCISDVFVTMKHYWCASRRVKRLNDKTKILNILNVLNVAFFAVVVSITIFILFGAIQMAIAIVTGG